jgi:hypothetical protein
LKSAVVRNIALTPRTPSSAANSRGESEVSRSMMTRPAPLSSAPQTSKVAASKETFETWATRSEGPSET